MTPTRLKRCEPLYTHSRYMGAASILRGFLGLHVSAPVPLSLSHGIDCAQYHNPIDVETIEPVHWSYNRDIHESASKVKPSIMAPHPWAIVVEQQKQIPGHGVLLIGPPPSPANDENLFKLIEHESLSDWSVLVKARGAFEDSIRFWNDRGIRTVTASNPDGTFYKRLYTVLSGYETVVGGNFSSALIFAAAIGKKIRLLRDYTWETYDTTSFIRDVWLESPRARRIVRAFADGTNQEKTEVARELLGFDMLAHPGRVRDALLDALASLKRPFSVHPDNPIPYKVRELLTIATKKPGFLRYSGHELLSIIRRQQVCILRMNDIDAWLNGPSDANCRMTPILFQKGITHPGSAPRGYAR